MELFSNQNIETYQTLLGGTSKLIGGIKDFTAPDIDYDILNLKAGQKENQALQLEVQATQIANRLREQFSESVGGYQYGAARRGVKVGEGSAMANIEQSAKALGKDVNQLDTNAKRMSGTLRREAKGIRQYAGKMKEVGDTQKMFNLIDSIAGSFKTFSSIGVKTKGEVEEESIKVRQDKDILGTVTTGRY